ncbi:Uncharacterised protein [Bordetella pertussis]|nr:Uncharacterised protein [Bordetella pertussis]
MPQNGTLRPKAKFLPLKNEALLTIATPAYIVRTKATQAMMLSWMGSLLSMASQTKPATSAAAAGLGSPWKKRLSTTAMLVLKRARRKAAPATYTKAASQPQRPRSCRIHS